VADAEIVNPGVRTPAYPGHSDGHQSLRGHSRRHVDLARVASALCCGWPADPWRRAPVV